MHCMNGKVMVDIAPAGNIECTKEKLLEKIDGIIKIMILDRCILHENISSVYNEH